MSDHIPMPTIKNKLIVKKYNFTLIVLAYRALTEDELRIAYSVYLRSNKLKHPPKNKIVTVLSSYDNNL